MKLFEWSFHYPGLDPWGDTSPHTFRVQAVWSWRALLFGVDLREYRKVIWSPGFCLLVYISW